MFIWHRDDAEMDYRFISFSLTIAIFVIGSLGVNLAIGFLLVKEMGVDSLLPVFVKAVVYALVQVSFTCICIFISMHVKKLGAAIGLNEIILFLLNIIAELLAEYSWAENILKVTPAGQTLFALVAESPADIMISILVSVIWILLIAAAYYITFRKTELK